jgi:hypothetical protein
VTTVEETCSHCQGIGSVGGSFPGMMGPYTPGRTCPICFGSGRVTKPVPAEKKPVKIDLADIPFAVNLNRARQGLKTREAERAMMTTSLERSRALSTAAVELSKARAGGDWVDRVEARTDYDIAFYAYTDPFGVKANPPRLDPKPWLWGSTRYDTCDPAGQDFDFSPVFRPREGYSHAISDYPSDDNF